MWRCADCNKVFFSSNHGPNTLDGRTLCDDCLTTRMRQAQNTLNTRSPPPTVRVSPWVTTSSRASPNWAAVAISGAVFMRSPVAICGATMDNGPPSTEMTMDQMLAKVDQILHLSPDERAAAKKIIRQMWGYVD